MTSSKSRASRRVRRGKLKQLSLPICFFARAHLSLCVLQVRPFCPGRASFSLSVPRWRRKQGLERGTSGERERERKRKREAAASSSLLKKLRRQGEERGLPSFSPSPLSSSLRSGPFFTADPRAHSLFSARVGGEERERMHSEKRVPENDGEGERRKRFRHGASLVRSPSSSLQIRKTSTTADARNCSLSLSCRATTHEERDAEEERGEQAQGACVCLSVPAFFVEEIQKSE